MFWSVIVASTILGSIDDEPTGTDPIASNLDAWRSLRMRARRDGPVALWRW
jgi:hypothetical protein